MVNRLANGVQLAQRHGQRRSNKLVFNTDIENIQNMNGQLQFGRTFMMAGKNYLNMKESLLYCDKGCDKKTTIVISQMGNPAHKPESHDHTSQGALERQKTASMHLLRDESLNDPNDAQGPLYAQEYDLVNNHGVESLEQINYQFSTAGMATRFDHSKSQSREQ